MPPKAELTNHTTGIISKASNESGGLYTQLRVQSFLGAAVRPNSALGLVFELITKFREPVPPLKSALRFVPL